MSSKIELEEVQMRAENLNTRIVCMQDEFALYLYSRTHHVSRNSNKQESNWIFDTCRKIESKKN